MKIKGRKLVKQSKITTYQSRSFENPVVVDIKSIITEHLKSLHNLSTIPDKLFGTKWSNPVKLNKKREVWYLLLRVF